MVLFYSAQTCNYKIILQYFIVCYGNMILSGTNILETISGNNASMKLDDWTNWLN